MEQTSDKIPLVFASLFPYLQLVVCGINGQQFEKWNTHSNQQPDFYE